MGDEVDDFGECRADDIEVPERFLIRETQARYSSGGPADLIVWRKAMELTKLVYVITRNWPSDERFGLTSQVRRSAVSVPANIAEGHGRSGDREFLHHLSIASGSLRELETLLEIGRDAEYLVDEQFLELMVLCQATRRPLRGLIAHLKGKS